MARKPVSTIVSETTVETVRSDYRERATTPVWVTTRVTMVDGFATSAQPRVWTHRDVQVFESTEPIRPTGHFGGYLGQLIGHHADGVDVSFTAPWENVEARIDRLQAASIW